MNATNVLQSFGPSITTNAGEESPQCLKYSTPAIALLSRVRGSPEYLGEEEKDPGHESSPTDCEEAVLTFRPNRGLVTGTAALRGRLRGLVNKQMLLFIMFRMIRGIGTFSFNIGMRQ